MNNYLKIINKHNIHKIIIPNHKNLINIKHKKLISMDLL